MRAGPSCVPYAVVIRPTPGAAEAAGLLRTDEETVERMAAAGELPGRMLGATWRFSRAAILRWLGGEDEEG